MHFKSLAPELGEVSGEVDWVDGRLCFAEVEGVRLVTLAGVVSW